MSPPSRYSSPWTTTDRLPPRTPARSAGLPSAPPGGPGGQRQPHRRPRARAPLAPLEAEPRAHDAPDLAQVAQHGLRRVDRHREADALGVLGDERVDADDPAP